MNATQTGTAFPIATNANAFPVIALGMGDQAKQRTDGNGRPKAAPTGEVTYSTGCVLRVATKDGGVRNDKIASIAVINPASVYELGEIYVAQGDVFVQPYQSGEGASARLAYSITVERLVPASQTSAGNRASAEKGAPAPTAKAS